MRRAEQWKCVLNRLFYKTTGLLRRSGLPLIILLVLFVRMSYAQNFQTSNANDILQQFKNQRVLWTTNIWTYANTLFGILAVIEFAWSAAVMLLEKTDLQSWTSALIRKLMWIGAFYALLINGRTWIPAIIDSFSQIGANAAGMAGPLSPGDVFVQGLNIAGALMDSASTSAFFTNPGTSMSLVLCALLIVISYIIITIHFIVTMVESYLVVSVGFIFLGFGGSRWTVPYTERYIGLAVSIGIKIVLLYCLISAGMNLGLGWIQEAQTVGQSPHPNMVAFDVMGAALIFMMCCWHIPKLFAAVLGGAPALTGGDLIGTTTALVGAGLTAASLGVGAVAAVGSGVAVLTGTSAAANAGGSSSGVSAAVASTGSGRSGGNSSGGSVPPPASPSGPSVNGNGTPKQPGPPAVNSGTAAALDPPAAPAPTAPSLPRRSSNAPSRIANPGTRLVRPRVPSDAAPHATPPRMPVEHQD
jgi:type IV secretion system protein TrbL